MKIPSDQERCLHTRSNGYRCRRERLPGQSLCGPHSRLSPRQAARNARQHDDVLRDYFSAEIASQLFPSKRDRRLDSAHAINRFLARVVCMIAENKINAKTGSALCYAGQTLLASLPHVTRERDQQAQTDSHLVFTPAQLASAAGLIESLADELQASGHGPWTELVAAEDPASSEAPTESQAG